jgi:hypothetical protein
MKTRMTTGQRWALRDHVSAVGVSKSPELLTALSEIADTDDFPAAQGLCCRGYSRW